jgi:hypothetical protein
MDWLDPPFQFFHPRPELPFELPVASYEVGMARRSILDPPYYVDRPTIRFHLAKPIPPGLFLAIKTGGSAETEWISAEELEQRSYLDFTNQILIRKVFAIYDDLIDRVRRQVPFPNLKQMERLSPKSSEALTLRLTRHGLRIDTIYDVEVVER